MAVIGFVSQKGGVGKTTLSRALAREAAASGLKVKLIDLDTQQGTAVNWARRRAQNAAEPHVSVESYKEASQALLLKAEYDLLVLDGPARASKGTLDIAKHADLVIQPTGASIDDLEPAILTFRELAQRGISREKLVFALCRVGTEAERADCEAYISEAGFTLLKGCLFERPGYRNAQNRGLSVTETRYPKLNEKADRLIQEIVDRI